MIGFLLGNWQRFALYGAVVLLIAGMLELDGYRRGEKKLFEYQAKEATARVAIVQKRGEVVTKIETKYVPKIQKIYVQGDTIERTVVQYVTKADDAGCTVPVGFVRLHNAAWSGVAGSPAESDRRASGIPLSEVAKADAGNAEACLVYKAQRDGLIEFYKGLQAVR